MKVADNSVTFTDGITLQVNPVYMINGDNQSTGFMSCGDLKESVRRVPEVTLLVNDHFKLLGVYLIFYPGVSYHNVKSNEHNQDNTDIINSKLAVNNFLCMINNNMSQSYLGSIVENKARPKGYDIFLGKYINTMDRDTVEIHGTIHSI